MLSLNCVAYPGLSDKAAAHGAEIHAPAANAIMSDSSINSLLI